MKHYSREVERSNARVVELERVKSSYEANLAAIGSSWGQVRGEMILVKTIIY